jgi:hypothetical protein
MKALDYEFSVCTSNIIRKVCPDATLELLAGIPDETLRANGFTRRSINEVREAMKNQPLHVEPVGPTLRDLFAMAALPAIITATSAGKHQPSRERPNIEAAMVADAFAIADEMMKERVRDQN